LPELPKFDSTKSKLTAEIAEVRRENAEVALALPNQFPSLRSLLWQWLESCFFLANFNRPGQPKILLCAPLRFAAASAVKGFGS
jgi:hypothetical protein